MSSPRPTLVIASIGVSPLPINTTIVSEQPPEFRNNGGDLQEGDRWYDTNENVESIYISGEWVQPHSPINSK